MMEKKHHLQKLRLQRLALILISLLLVTACTQEASPEDKSQAASKKDFQSYSHDGLSLKHPYYWTLAYDESPSLYADRGVSFNASEYSGISVFIFKDRSMSASKLADYFERRLRLNSTDHIKDYQREPIQIAGFKGFKLIWKNTMFDIFPVEVTILTTIDSPDPAFVVFHLLDDDIKKESPHIIPFINSISIQ